MTSATGGRHRAKRELHEGKEMSNPHHANGNIPLYAEQFKAWSDAGAPEGREPWREWEFRVGRNNDWLHSDASPVFSPLTEYRHTPKPRTVTVYTKDGPRELPEPMRVEPVRTFQFFWISCYSILGDEWSGSVFDKNALAAGLCFTTREHAEEWLRFETEQRGGTPTQESK